MLQINVQGGLLISHLFARSVEPPLLFDSSIIFRSILTIVLNTVLNTYSVDQCEYSGGEGDMVNYSINQCEYSEGEGYMVNYSIDQCEYSKGEGNMVNYRKKTM